MCNAEFSGDIEYCPTHNARLVLVDRRDIDRIGDVIAGRYHIKSVLGSGGMGTVYRAIQEPIGRDVAIKILHPDLARDNTFITRFHTEAKAASALLNPNTVNIYDFGQTNDNTLFIAMEHLGGVSLADRLAEGALPWKHAVAISVQVCRALAEAHRKRIVHRDLKPENIMLSAADDGSLLVKVLDFGIAKMLEVPGRTMSGVPVTQVGVIIGTPQYMSPEQARGGEPSPASDLYALGIILFESISGAAPFNDDEPIITLSLQMRSPVPSLSSPFGAVPYALSNLIGALLRKDPIQRPGPADDIGKSLKRLVGALNIPGDEVLSVPARHLRLASDDDGDSFEDVDLTEAVDASNDQEAEDLSVTRPNRSLPEYQSLISVSDEDPTLLTELPPPGSGLTLEIDEEEEYEFDEVTPPVELPRAAFYPPGAMAIEPELPNSLIRDQDKTTVRSVASSPNPPVISPPKAPSSQRVVPPPTIPLTAEELEELEEEPGVRKRRMGIMVALLVVFVVVAGAITGWFILSDLSSQPGGEDERASQAGMIGGGALDGDSGALPLTDEVVAPNHLATLDAGYPSEAAADGGSDLPSIDTQPIKTDAALSTNDDQPISLTKVVFTSSPSGAKIYLGDDFICETSCEHDFPTGEQIRLRFQHPNFRDRHRTITPGVDRTVRMSLGSRHRGTPPTKTKSTLQPWL